MRGKRLRQTGGLGFREHPRVCGENPLHRVLGVRHTGTSPRMRGKRRRHRKGPSGVRNIPAYAGKTGILAVSPQGAPEHPRVCGENRIVREDWDACIGTSPRMRGKLLLQTRVVHLGRNIPAYAGKTQNGGGQPISVTEHPRVCGENSRMVSRTDSENGTSPRMRGKQTLQLVAMTSPRNIPAYAGKTRSTPL